MGDMVGKGGGCRVVRDRHDGQTEVPSVGGRGRATAEGGNRGGAGECGERPGGARRAQEHATERALLHPLHGLRWCVDRLDRVDDLRDDRESAGRELAPEHVESEGAVGDHDGTGAFTTDPLGE